MDSASEMHPREPVDQARKQPRARRARLLSTLRDYIILTKPIVVALLLVTTVAAMLIGAGEWPPFPLLMLTILGGALTAGGASAVNHFIDRESDGQMQRTRNRPLPAGRLSPVSVLTFGLVLGILGVAVYAVFVNLLSALLAGFGYLYYVIFYSIYLKRSTPHNIVVGGGAGAVPPLVGWAAATGQLSMAAFFLFAFVFFWTPPHFWALALLKRRDYARAGVPMLPVVVGGEATRRQILLCSLQLVALSVILPLADLGGWLFLAMAIPSGIALLAYAWRLWRKGGNRIAWKMYRYSSTYLAVIFAALVFDTFI